MSYRCHIVVISLLYRCVSKKHSENNGAVRCFFFSECFFSSGTRAVAQNHCSKEEWFVSEKPLREEWCCSSSNLKNRFSSACLFQEEQHHKKHYLFQKKNRFSSACLFQEEQKNTTRNTICCACLFQEEQKNTTGVLLFKKSKNLTTDSSTLKNSLLYSFFQESEEKKGCSVNKQVNTQRKVLLKKKNPKEFWLSNIMVMYWIANLVMMVQVRPWPMINALKKK